MPVNPNQLFLQGGNYYAVNPATGQAEPVFQDLNEPNPQATGGTEYAGPQFQPTYYFQSDLPSGAIPIALQKDTPSNSVAPSAAVNSPAPAAAPEGVPNSAPAPMPAMIGASPSATLLGASFCNAIGIAPDGRSL